MDTASFPELLQPSSVLHDELWRLPVATGSISLSPCLTFVALFQQQLVPAQRSVPSRLPHHAPPGPQTERGGRIFCALHTYGRQLNQHLHIYLSVTHSRMDIKYGIWRDLLFKKHAVEEI
ncbi:transposase [Klebsiella oxytoca]|uniref:transposase n=1 Tax=Klebsiella oxytoca TaxID=571 RepID=UPI002B1BE400|nr:transposase [Klebsiella oxytoca]